MRVARAGDEGDTQVLSDVFSFPAQHDATLCMYAFRVSVTTRLELHRVKLCFLCP